MDAVDIAIIGAGITGVGIAQRAQAAGYRVLLLEQGGIGEQTSANSSKLIHGGLRYLENGQLSLVRQSLAQRKALLTLAPKLVKPVPFYIPIYQGSQRGPLAIRAGLSLYAMLSEFDTLGHFNAVDAKEWPSLGLKLNGLRAVFRYWDAQTDDHQLTVAVAKSAQALGAQIKTQVQVEQISHDHSGCVLSFRQSDKTISAEPQQIFAKCVINSTGPWVNQTLDLVSPAIEKVDIELVQGSHLLLNIPPPAGILYLESIFDKRVVFVIPWQGKTLIGTTETAIDSPDKAGITQAEIHYLLGIYAHYFPQHGDENHLRDNIVRHYCGIRVLPKQQGDAFDLPRETLMRSSKSHPHILTIYGGKLTTFRHTAKEALQWASDRLGVRPIKADVDKLSLD
ncbi:glycerol-3-phosphate dehydrogenase/oxidase [Shewanella sp. Isolate11]|uniref:glycerol-3-phosphate dehydrogenase/oxidase n=1 Tax=Shewanella sp. Isolate11 TaxID=2908530 RepID=UPI001EFE54D2|nr:glycerol-3-phosphate dehydrogenase/oxidase [Shewanella sp. Isolate11]MCG9697641.1 glycerol-3-phosphate dehydrogenase/oxidase [Shewanella sp. Isolate11]